MKRFLTGLAALSIGVLGMSTFTNFCSADSAAYGDEELLQPASSSASETTSIVDDSETSSGKELMEAKEAMDSMNDSEELKPKYVEPASKKAAGKKSRSAEAFVVGPDWEFDGFVAGGQDQDIKSMFAVNDLVYLNVGSGQGFSSGDVVGIFRRGEQIRDPQTGRVMGFEVRKIAVSEVSDRIEPENSSARILKSYEAVEIGDLVRREE